MNRAAICELAIRSYSYFNGHPYPSRYSLRGWNKKKFGDFPGVLPLVFNACQQQTEALIGSGILLSVPGDRAFEEFLRVWQMRTKFSTRIQTAHYKAFNEGSVVLHFYLSPKTQELQFRILSSLFDCAIQYDEFDPATILKATITFPTYDRATNKHKLYIQEWTATTVTTYVPQELNAELSPTRTSGFGDEYDPRYHDVIDSYLYNPAKLGEPLSIENNPFAVVPFVEIHNLPSSEDTIPRGDCWKAFNLLDKINIGYHLMNVHAQNAAMPGIFLFDAVLPDGLEEGIEEIPSPAPGEILEIHSKVNDDGTVNRANVQIPTSDSKIFDVMNTYARDWVEQAQFSLGAAFISGDEFTNKGMLTSSILHQLYKPLVARVETKRISFGEHGLIPFFTLMANALYNLSSSERKNITGLKARPKKEILEIGTNKGIFIRWPDHFALTQQELSTQFDRIDAMVATGLISPRRALETLGIAEGWEDVDDLVEHVSEKLLERPVVTEVDPVSKKKEVPPMKSKSSLPEVKDRS